jgi:hypothetical protein
MNHQTYQDWLFTPDPLTAQQQVEFSEHLAGCSACQKLAGAWRAAEQELVKPQWVEPATGFERRFQARLQVERARLHRRQSMLVLGFSLAVAALLLASLMMLALPVFAEPRLWALIWLTRLVNLVNLADLATSIIAGFGRVALDRIPLMGWMLLAGIATELVVLWFVSLRLLLAPRSVENETI